MATSRTVNDPVPQIIYISNGAPTSASVTIAANQNVIFQNNDTTSYLLQLWTHGNNHQIDICPVLPAGGSLTYRPNPANSNGNGRCNYSVVTMSGSPTKPTAGGPNSIIIGSGND